MSNALNRQFDFFGVKFLYVVLSGFLFNLCFPHLPPLENGTPFLSIVAFVPLFIVLQYIQNSTFSMRTAILYVWLFGMVLHFTAFFWLLPGLLDFNNLSKSFGFALFAGTTPLFALYYIFLFSPYFLSNKILAQKELISIPIISILITALEILLPRNFNWAIGQSSNGLYFLQCNSLFGFNTGTFVIIFTNISLAKMFFAQNTTPIKKIILMNGILWSSILLFGFFRVYFVEKKLTEAQTVRLAYIQPNFSVKELNAKLYPASDVFKETTNRIFQMSAEAVTKSIDYDNKVPDLLVWPETAAPNEIFKLPAILRMVLEESRKLKVPFLFQERIERPKKNEPLHYESWSISKIVSEDGVGEEEFAKWVLMPFGETVPLENFFPFIGKIYRRIALANKIEKGTIPQSLNVKDKFKLGPLICFDGISQRLPYLQMKSHGVDFYVNQSNYAFFGRSSASFQFAKIDLSRAVENGRSMALISNTGPTVVFDPLGRKILPSTSIFTQSTGFVDIPVYSERTLFSYVYY